MNTVVLEQMESGTYRECQINAPFLIGGRAVLLLGIVALAEPSSSIPDTQNFLWMVYECNAPRPVDISGLPFRDILKSWYDWDYFAKAFSAGDGGAVITGGSAGNMFGGSRYAGTEEMVLRRAREFGGFRGAAGGLTTHDLRMGVYYFGEGVDIAALMKSPDIACSLLLDEYNGYAFVEKRFLLPMDTEREVNGRLEFENPATGGSGFAEIKRVRLFDLSGEGGVDALAAYLQSEVREDRYWNDKDLPAKLAFVEYESDPGSVLTFYSEGYLNSPPSGFSSLHAVTGINFALSRNAGPLRKCCIGSVDADLPDAIGAELFVCRYPVPAQTVVVDSRRREL